MVRLTLDDRYDAMPWDEVDAVVFDVGNVLLTFDPPALLREHLPEVPELHPMLLQRVFRSPYWPMLDHGTVTLLEAADAMCGRDEELRPYFRKIVTGWVRLRNPVAEGVAALRACKAHGKRCYVLSNYSREAFPVAEEMHDFFRLMDGKVISSEVGLLKPDPRIYRLLTDRFGLEPSRTLFIDDLPANIEGALYAGWQGLCFSEAGKLRRFFGLEEEQ